MCWAGLATRVASASTAGRYRGDRATKNFFETFGLVARGIVVHRPLTSS